MSDQDAPTTPSPAPAAPSPASVTSSPAPPPPSGRPPKVTNHGRSSVPISTSNSDFTDIPETEYFDAPGPRGYPPLTGYIDVSNVDMMRRPNERNKIEHHTEQYNSDQLIVRRGQEFKIKIDFNRPFNPAEDKFAVEFIIGSSPDYNKGTYIPVFPTAERQSAWKGRITDQMGTEVTMGITPLANCIVGKYSLYVAVSTPNVHSSFHVLSSGDAVFLNDEREREECVMTEVGIIYHGSFDDVAERDWNYGQFNYGVLDACLYIMDRSEMPITNRGDPVKVTRKASAMLNARDDDGVLVGNWSGDYTYGVAPTSWTGSTEILLTYASSKMPVCFAQCWVYAAVFNTFLRCLGIPSRVVTNFYSAHDNDGNLKTDIILHDNGSIDRNRTKDSIWNYHCWNECYMTRPDLPAGFGGWQVVDATPQETSDGMYRCGPASVQAIKHGQICYPFDAAFVFAEINSDVVFYSRSKDGTLQPVKVNRRHVGRMVLTKALGNMTRRDITDQYKFSEGSAEERTVLEKAEEYGCSRDKSDFPVGDVDVILPSLEISMGESFNLTTEFINRSDKKRTVNVYVSGSVVYYTGVISSEFLFETPTVKIGPNKSQHQTTMCLFLFTVGLKVNTNTRVKTKALCPADPAHLTLTHCGFSLIPEGASLTWTESFSPQRTGLTRVIATLDCPALRQVQGQATFTVNP
uniref:protein-glutamine gamma-glutamyltransferase n=1 Tax=Echeneis naucrates TaxID=173247 RepID=A0A665URP9_ECHNA